MWAVFFGAPGAFSRLLMPGALDGGVPLLRFLLFENRRELAGAVEAMLGGCTTHAVTNAIT